VLSQDEGHVYSWGGSTNAKATGFKKDGQGASDATFAGQISKPLASRTIKMIACGDFHSLALERTGQLWSWGGGG